MSLAMNVFKRSIEEHILDYMPEEYSAAEITFKDIRKNNVQKTGIMVTLPDRIAVPVVYIDGLYDEYIQGKDMEDIFKEIAEEIERGYREAPAYNGLNIKDYRNNVYMCLVNKRNNREMLSNIPHRTVNDLAVIYRINLPEINGNKASAVVTYDLMETLGYENTEQLEKQAAIYMKENNPPVVKTMREMLYEIEPELAEMLPEDEEMQMYVITNSSKTNGAVSVLDKETMDRVAGLIGPEIIILPSSIHEVIAVSGNDIKARDAAAMVKSINDTQVEPEERLSDNIYRYTKEKGLEQVKEREDRDKDIDRDIDI